MEIQVTYLPVADLVPYARNARTHSDDQVDQIARSIDAFGFINPVIVDDEGGIIAGHGRLLAAEQLGLDRVPTINAGHLSEEQKRAYILADNKLALNAGWDEHLLAIELGELSSLDDFDVTVTGFGLDEIGSLLDFGQGEFPSLPDEDREPFQQMTFVLHDEQAEEVKAAIKAAVKTGEYDSVLNTNKNGSALTMICENWMASHA